MANNQYQDIMELIESKVSGAVIGTNLEAGGFKQDSPDTCSAIMGAGGVPIYFSTSGNRDMDDIQMRVVSRGEDYITALNEADKYFNVLKKMDGYGFPIASPVYRLSSQAVAIPAKIGYDGEGRVEFSANYMLRVHSI